MATAEELGGDGDSVEIRIDGQVVKIAENYSVEVSILRQPSAFTLRMGWNKTAGELLQLAAPGKPFELFISSNGTKRLIQSGLIDSRGVPSAQYTQVEIRGRDYLAKLFDSFVEEEQEFPQKTYFDLTRKVLDIVGLTDAKGHFLQAINDVNRQLLTGVTARPRELGELATELQTGALGGTGELVFKTPKAKLGTRYYDFLQQQYKLVGLFIWASPDKTIVLARPHSNQPASYRIFRARGDENQPGATNVLDCMFKDDTTMRHSECIVYGKSGGGKKGVEICRGSFVDDEMFNNGFSKKLVIHDADVKTKDECEYVARRMLSDERRAGWQLEYTVAGHQVPSNESPTGAAIWGPDTVVRVDDEELHVSADPSLNFKKNFYLEAVTYARSPQTSTKLTLMRPGDLLFATSLTDDNEIIKRKQKNSQGRTVR